ncbi:MAG: NAD-dependent epimerase, partial [Verrucomicrobiota bacterium]|nr:NAD-dependent epimerase [Verrucomicrobiota bacterium]
MCKLTHGAAYEFVSFPKDRQAIDVGDFICDYSSFASSFGWEPRVSFEDGMLRSFEYFKEEIEHYL